jgi:hypothetical protein
MVRNVSNQPVQFKYKLPQSKYFAMAFPETIRLMAGMVIPLQIMFRPVKLLPYRCAPGHYLHACKACIVAHNDAASIGTIADAHHKCLKYAADVSCVSAYSVTKYNSSHRKAHWWCPLLHTHHKRELKCLYSLILDSAP